MVVTRNDDSGRKALHLAAATGERECIQFLLAKVIFVYFSDIFFS